MFDHTAFGFCIWDIPALLVLVATVVIFFVHRHKQKKREKEFEDQLTEKWADQAVEEKETVSQA